MPQFFIDRPFVVGETVEIRGSDARHIAQVLRLAAGDWILLSDGAGRSFRAGIAAASPHAVTATIREELPRRQGPPAPVLALALVKGDRFEWAIQKTVELGCRRILPFGSSRTVPQYANAADARRVARWQKIAAEAAKQSGLPFRPDIDPPATLVEILRKASRFGRVVLFYEGERLAGVRSLWPAGAAPSEREELLIVGPEGGFTDGEVKLAREAGAVTASLGDQILRVETAAVAAVALWQYELGNLDLPRA